MHNGTTRSMILVGVAVVTVGSYVIFGLWAAILIGVVSAWQLNQ